MFCNIDVGGEQRPLRDVAKQDLTLWSTAGDHWHLGPAAVERARQGQGIGSRLMAAVCTRLDELHGVGYLETDKSANVRLYRRGGFEVLASEPVLGVTNWFMRRAPRR